MEQHLFTRDNKETILIEIGGKRCEVIAFISVSDMEIVSEMLQIQSDQETDYKLIAAAMIANHTNNTFSENDIYYLHDDLLFRFIYLCLEDDVQLKRNYESLIISNRFERFIKAIQNSNEQNIEEFLKKTRSVLTPKAITSAETVLSNIQSVSQKMNAKQREIKSLSEIVDTWQMLWQSTLADSIQALSDSCKVMLDYSDAFSRLSATLIAFAKTIQAPTVTEEEKKRLIESYSLWGKFGWTVPPNASFRTFRIEPVDEEYAYNILRRYFKKTDIESLFDKIKQLKHIRKSDLNEAINCYNTRNYKGCTLILLSLIDARLIRSQRDEDRNKKGLRPTGKKAANNLFKRMESKYYEENMLYTTLKLINTSKALYMIYEKGDDFKKQPKVINRNFVSHGMLHRKVTRKDCIMLFLLLYNFTNLLNLFTDN